MSKSVQQIDAASPIRDSLKDVVRIVMACLSPTDAAMPNLIVVEASWLRAISLLEMEFLFLRYFYAEI